MKAFYSKFFNPVLKQSQKKWATFSAMKFTTFKIEVNDGVLNTFSENHTNPALNWQLAKAWVTPSGNVHVNSVSSTQGSGQSNEECQVTSDVKAIEYERFVRKFGLIISKEANVYVQDGVYNSKKVRLITSDKNDAELFSGIFQEKLNSNDNPDVHVMLLSNHSQIGNKRRFAYTSKTKKTVLSNSRNLENIKKGIDLI